MPVGERIVIGEIRTRCFDNDNFGSNRFKVSAEMHRALQGDDALLPGFNIKMAKDRLIGTVSVDRTNDNLRTGWKSE